MPPYIPHTKHQNQIGFSMLEVMLIIGIISLLTLFAVPSYRSYTIRAQIVEGMSLVQPIKEDISMQLTLSASNKPLHMPDTTHLGNEHIKGVTVGQKGQIIITYYDLDQNGSPDTLILTPHRNGSTITWDCKEGSLANEHRPIRCRAESK